MTIKAVAAHVRSILLANGLDVRDQSAGVLRKNTVLMSFHVDKAIHDEKNTWVGGGLLYFDGTAVYNTSFSVSVSDPNFAVNLMRVIKSSRIYERQVMVMKKRAVYDMVCDAMEGSEFFVSGFDTNIDSELLTWCCKYAENSPAMWQGAIYLDGEYVSDHQVMKLTMPGYFTISNHPWRVHIADPCFKAQIINHLEDEIRRRNAILQENVLADSARKFLLGPNGTTNNYVV